MEARNERVFTCSLYLKCEGRMAFFILEGFCGQFEMGAWKMGHFHCEVIENSGKRERIEMEHLQIVEKFKETTGKNL